MVSKALSIVEKRKLKGRYERRLLDTVHRWRRPRSDHHQHLHRARKILVKLHEMATSSDDEEWKLRLELENTKQLWLHKVPLPVFLFDVLLYNVVAVGLIEVIVGF